MIGETRVRFPLALPIPHRLTGSRAARGSTRRAPEERHALARAILGSVDSQILPKFPGTVTTESLEHDLTRENLRIGDTSKRNTVNGGKRDRHGGAQPSISDANG